MRKIEEDIRPSGSGLKIALAAGASLMAFGVAAPAFSQAVEEVDEAADERFDDDDDVVIVTGSRIARQNGEAPVPLQVIGQEEAQLSGFNNIADFLADVPALQGSTVPDDTTGASNGIAGLSLLNLRQLGVNRTLVLVNGRRHVAANDGTAAVDVNTIPFNLIERTEIITGGASSIYGADAVSGVVNFILKDDFEGVEIDGQYALNDEGNNQSFRTSILAGGNFADGRGNATVSLEYRQNEELFPDDLDFNLNAASLVRVDSDSDLNGDGIQESDGIPNFALIQNGTLGIISSTGVFNVFDGITGRTDLTDNFTFDELTGQLVPVVGAGSGTPLPTPFNSSDPAVLARCFNLDANGTPVSFLPDFDPNNQLAPPLQQDPGCVNTSNTLIGGPANPLDQFPLVGTEVPESENITLNGTFRYDLTDRIRVFGEGKYFYSNNSFTFQPSFFSGGTPNNIVNPSAVEIPGTDDGTGNPVTTTRLLGAPFGLSGGVGTDNPFIPAELVNIINNGAPGPDLLGGGVGGFGVAGIQRFQTEFNRGQTTTRQTFRAVLGAEGDFDTPLSSDPWTWDTSFNFGRSTQNNVQENSRLDERFFAGIDAIQITQEDLDNIALAGGDTDRFAVGENVCRVQLFEELGLPTDLNVIGAVSQRTLDECIPINIFGLNAIGPDEVAFASTNLNDTNEIEQLVIGGNVTGGLGDWWGAGEIQFAAGVEYRREDSATAPSSLPLIVESFSNETTPTVGRFDVIEGYLEAYIPIVSDGPIGLRELDATGSLRVSDYSTIGGTVTWAAQGQWSPIEELRFRGGYAVAIRAPNINELFQAETQTFLQIDDPCSVENLPESDAGPNRAANCLALGVPGTFLDPNPNISNTGRIGGNPSVAEETSRSYFAGVTWNPSLVPNLTLVADFYNIVIEDAIDTVPIQQIVDDCVDGDGGPVLALCNLFERDPATFEIIDFLQSPINIGFLETRGVDFQGRYTKDINEILAPIGMDSAKDLGALNLQVTGTNIIFLNELTDASDIGTFDASAGQQGVPQWRFNFDATWAWKDLQLTYTLDWQSSQRVLDEDGFFASVDDRNSEFGFTSSFAQHDFTGRYQVNDNLAVRAGIVNAFDNEPPLFAPNNIFDIFGRRFFVGATATF